MIVTFAHPKTGEEAEFELDLDDMDLNQASFIQRNFKLTPVNLIDRIKEMDPAACGAAYWLMMRQNGITVDPQKMNFKIVKFSVAIVEAMLGEVATNYGLTTDQLKEFIARSNRDDVPFEEILEEEGIDPNPTSKPSDEAEAATT